MKEQRFCRIEIICFMLFLIFVVTPFFLSWTLEPIINGILVLIGGLFAVFPYLFSLSGQRIYYKKYSQKNNKRNDQDNNHEVIIWIF